MAIVSVMYPSKAGSKFDMEYYLHNHMKMVADTWGKSGLRGYTVLKGVGAPGGGEAPFQVVVNLDFTSAEAFATSVAETGAKVMGDVPNFTDLQPTIQISEVSDTYTSHG